PAFLEAPALPQGVAYRSKMPGTGYLLSAVPRAVAGRPLLPLTTRCFVVWRTSFLRVGLALLLGTARGRCARTAGVGQLAVPRDQVAAFSPQSWVILPRRARQGTGETAGG